MSVAEIAKPRRNGAEPPESSAPHVYSAIAAVTAALAKEGVGKGGKNQQQGYAFRGIDQVMNALAGLLAQEQLVIIPHIRSRELTERQTMKGGALFNVVVLAEYTFISAYDGSTHTVGPFYGEAMDSADKATNKAMSAAYKYMAIQTFCIPTEGDNDADATTHEVAPAAGGERPTPANPQPRPQPPHIRRVAEPFIAKAKSELEGCAGDIDALHAMMDDIKAREGWSKLNEAERGAITAERNRLVEDVLRTVNYADSGDDATGAP